MSFKEALRQPEIPKPVKRSHPKGWEPSLTVTGDSAVGVSLPQDGCTDPDERTLIAGWELDPDEWQIVGDVHVRRWQQTPDGDWLRYFRCDLRRRSKGDRPDIDRLVRAAEKSKAPKTPTVIDGDGPAMVVSLNDWQIGKGEGGGTEATVTRIVAAIAAVMVRLALLEKAKQRPSRVVLANTGDLIEKVAGHYPSQPFTVDLNEREQLRVARRLVMRFVSELTDRGYPVTVTAVPCNHGENRNGNGKAQTTPDDNASLTIVENVQEACEANPDRYRHVSFAYARDLTLVLPVNGVNVGMTHGHQISGSGGTATALEKWWAGQIMGRQAVADADILMTAHRHHFQISEETGRTVMLAPAMDGGSYWFTSATGKTSPPGMLTVLVDERYPRGWDGLVIL